MCYVDKALVFQAWSGRRTGRQNNADLESNTVPSIQIQILLQIQVQLQILLSGQYLNTNTNTFQGIFESFVVFQIRFSK